MRYESLLCPKLDSLLKSDFNAILDHHAPIRHMRVRQSSVPWLTSDIKRVMKERAVKYGSHNHWVLYQSARNKVNSMVRTAKSDYFRRKIDASKATDPKTGWKLINSLTGRGNKSSPVNDILVNDRIVSDDKDISESFNDFFVNIHLIHKWPPTWDERAAKHRIEAF